MTITRSLLSKLHLPYKQLGIEGSKGDQLYLPDDVGINLSLSHGLSGSDMVPHIADKNGRIGTYIGSDVPFQSLADAIPILSETTVTGSIQVPDIDLRGFYYIVLFLSMRNPIAGGTDVSTTINTYDIYGDPTINFGAISINNPGTVFQEYGLNPISFPAFSPLRIGITLTHPTDTADIRLDAFLG